MEGWAASFRGGPQTDLLAELGKTGADSVIGQRVAPFRDKEHVGQGVIAVGGTQRTIAVERGSRGRMEGDKPRLVELGLTNVHEWGSRAPSHVSAREAEGFPDPQPGTGQETDHRG